MSPGDSSLLGRIATGLRETARSLSPAVRAERAYALGRGRLIHEAALRALAGSRTWSADVAPRAYGRGYDERVVEYPWLYEHLGAADRLLDVGCALNHRMHIELVRQRCRQLVFLNPYRDEGSRDRSAGVCYVRGDVRRSGLRPGGFPNVACLSTLEHVGCDNTRYGAPAGRDGDPTAARAAAMRAMRELCAPGGRLLLTVPFGRLEDHGWFVQLDRPALDAALAAFRPARTDLVFFLHGDGWRLATAAECATARYGEQTRGASAVACVALSA